MKIQNPRLESALKMVVLFGLALFLYTRITNGSLLFYINQRFAWLTLVAAIGLVLVAVSYQSVLRRGSRSQSGDHDHSHHHAHTHDHDHPHDHAHDHAGHDHAGHNHGLSWEGVVIVLLPIVLGLLVPPRPLGASALATREVEVGATTGMPAAIRASSEKTDLEKNILDWAYEFQSTDLAQVVGREANVEGFVFKDEQFGDSAFSLTRYIVSCCVADAAYAGLLVQGVDLATLENDQWLRVRGRFELTNSGGQTVPVLIAESAEPIAQPVQPYLYP